MKRRKAELKMPLNKKRPINTLVQESENIDTPSANSFSRQRFCAQNLWREPEGSYAKAVV